MVLAPIAKLPTVAAQLGASGSDTVTLLKGTLPVLITLIVKFAVCPYITVCVSGVFWMSIAGATLK